MAMDSATIEVGQPRLFTMRAVMMLNAYGLLLVAPLLAAILIVSVIPFGALTILIPVAVVVAAALLLPFGLGNAHIARLVRSLVPEARPGADGFVVQLTLCPRLRSGTRATLEDADDVGWLSFGATGLVYTGDSAKLSVPYQQIKWVRPGEVGPLGGLVYRRRINLVVAGLPQVTSLEFAERSSVTLPGAIRTTRQLRQRLAAKGVK